MQRGTQLSVAASTSLLAVAALCWLGGLQSGGNSELLSAPLRERVSNLESQAKEIESVRQDARFLDHEIAELEKRGESRKIHEPELKAKAAELRERLLGLAKQAEMTAPRVLTRHHDQNLASGKVPIPSAEPVHRSIDDPYFKGSDHAVKKSGPSAEEIGALALVEETKQDPAHFEHRFGGLGEHGVEAWEVAPKQNVFGEEEHASLHYLNRHHKPSWLYAPNEAADGTDVPPGAKAAPTRKYLHRYGGHTSETPSWSYNPKIGKPAWKVSPRADKTTSETPAQHEASTWFKDLREGQEGAGRSASGAEFGKHFADFRSELDGRMAHELRTLRAADKAVAAMRQRAGEEVGTSDESGGSPLARSAAYLKGLLAAERSTFGRQAEYQREHSVDGQAQALDKQLRKARSHALAEQQQQQQGKEDRPLSAGEEGEKLRRRAAAAWSTVEGMEMDLQSVEAKERFMSGGERNQLQPDVDQMRAALQGARVTAASEQRSEQRLEAARAAQVRAAHAHAEEEGRKAAELRPLTKQALQAEQQVRQIKAALAKAKEQAATVKKWQGMSKLDKLGINTGEVHTRWGGSQIV